MPPHFLRCLCSGYCYHCLCCIRLLPPLYSLLAHCILLPPAHRTVRVPHALVGAPHHVCARAHLWLRRCARWWHVWNLQERGRMRATYTAPQYPSWEAPLLLARILQHTPLAPNQALCRICRSPWGTRTCRARVVGRSQVACYTTETIPITFLPRHRRILLLIHRVVLHDIWAGATVHDIIPFAWRTSWDATRRCLPALPAAHGFGTLLQHTAVEYACP